MTIFVSFWRIKKKGYGRTVTLLTKRLDYDGEFKTL